jgi:hypothetical protein
LGISQKAAQDLITSTDPEIIRNQINCLPYRSNIDNTPAFLIQAIKDNFPLPPKYKQKLAEKNRENEEELKAKYNQYLIAQVDQYHS